MAETIDASYFDLLGIKPVASRLLDEQYGEDTVLLRTNTGEVDAPPNPSVVINEAAARALGYATPQDAVGQYRRWRRTEVGPRGAVQYD